MIAGDEDMLSIYKEKSPILGKISFFSFALCLSLLGWSAPAAALPYGANVITDFNFDGDPLGAPLPTTFPGVAPTPQHTVYAVGGFPDSGPLTGTVTVQNVGSLNHAALMTTTQGGIGALYVDTQFSTVSDRVLVSFDIHIVDVPTTGLPQAGTTAPGGQAFVIQAFGNGPNAQNRVFRFVATPTSATGGTFGMRNNTDGELVTLGSYSEGTTYHVEIEANFINQTVDVALDNALVLDDLPFVSFTTNLFELFVFQNGVEGQTNSVAFDNLVTAEVPEPAALALLMGGLAGLGLSRRRRRAA